MSIKILISFEVRDVSETKSVCDAAADARTEAGIAAEATGIWTPPTMRG